MTPELRPYKQPILTQLILPLGLFIVLIGVGMAISAFFMQPRELGAASFASGVATTVAGIAVCGIAQVIDLLGRAAHHAEATAIALRDIQKDMVAIHSTIRISAQAPQASAADSGTRAMLSKATNHLEAIETNTAHTNALIEWAANQNRVGA